MNFASDNVVGASQAVLEAICAANVGAEPSYGADVWSQKAIDRLRQVFEAPQLQAWFVSTGTVANSLALSALVSPWGGVICQSLGHVAMDESTAPELFTGGARLLPVRGCAGKLRADDLQAFIGSAHPPHNVSVQAVSLTQATENGLVYTPEEVASLSKICRAQGWSLHMDGARFANATAALGCSPADLTWRAGVDVLCLGASKNGALVAEAVVFFNPDQARDFEHRVKRAGQMAAKGRFFGAQFNAWLADDHWLELAKHANRCAQMLGAGLSRLPGVSLVWPVQANEIFVCWPDALAQHLRDSGAHFYDWYPHAVPEGWRQPDRSTVVRLVCSFATDPADCERLILAAENFLMP